MLFAGGTRLCARNPPLLRTWLAGSAGSGKSTTIKTVVSHSQKMFKEAVVLAQIELTAYTGVAAFHIGFAAKTTCSSFQIFPNGTDARWYMHDLDRGHLDDDQKAHFENEPVWLCALC